MSVQYSMTLTLCTLFLFFHTYRTIASSIDKRSIDKNNDDDYAKFQEPLLELSVT